MIERNARFGDVRDTDIFEIVDDMRKEQATIEMQLEQFALVATPTPLKEAIHPTRREDSQTV